VRKKFIDIIKNIDYPYTSAIVNNERIGFLDEVDENSKYELIKIDDMEGMRTYERTLTFLISYILMNFTRRVHFHLPNLNFHTIKAASLTIFLFILDEPLLRS